MSDIIRIGRSANAAERGLQHVIENPHVLDHVTQNLIADESGLTPLAVIATWEEMCEAEKQEWRVEAVARLREFVAEYIPPEPRFGPRRA